MYIYLYKIRMILVLNGQSRAISFTKYLFLVEMKSAGSELNDLGPSCLKGHVSLYEPA